MNWYVDVLKKFNVFTGRSGRQEYWMFVLINFGISFAIGLLVNMNNFFAVVSALYGLAIIVPSIAASIRRMHDIGKSGIYVLVTLIPCVGTIWFIILAATPGDPGANEYGPPPEVNKPSGFN